MLLLRGQGEVTVMEQIQSPAAWLAEDMRDVKEWVINLSSEQIEELRNSLRAIQKLGLSISEMTTANFTLSSFERLIAEVRTRLEEGRGVVVLRGFPALRFNTQELRLIYWGLGLHLGTPVSQSSKGDLLGDVRDFGDDVSSRTGRGYMSRQKLGFHADTADVVGLMVLRPAKTGGLSYICSSVSVHNEIARTRPDLLQCLYEPYYLSWKGQEEVGGNPYYQQPLFTFHKGKFASRFIRTHVIAAHNDFPELGALGERKLEAMDMVSSLASDPRFHFSMMFEPGDIQLLNNHVTYHSRSEYEDYEEQDRKRHLLRMWLSMPNTRELSPLMSAIYPQQKGGAVRGGFPSRTGAHTYMTEKPLE